MAAIFISYRKQGEDKGAAFHLAEDLREAFGEDSVFLDEHGLGVGRFEDQLLEQAQSCKAMIAVIGPAWNDRIETLHDPQDWVRRELEVALRRDILMVPVVLDQARLPQQSELPLPLGKLLQYQSVSLYPRFWKETVNDLIDALSDRLHLRKQHAGAAAAAIPNLSGHWSDTDGVRFRLEQRGEDVQISMLDVTGRTVGQGAGAISGNQVRFSLQRPDYGQGSGFGTVSPDGRQISGAIQYGFQKFGFSISKD